ncbi:ATP-binding protein [Streptomyces sp. NPDC058618]|uniref:ATP-binding protein n=1 Tax=unclassified Streptomyces TaxID=2593676 RepID=UPI00365C8889
MSPQIIDISLPSTLQAAGQARRALSTCVSDRDVADEGSLLLSEAVANAVEHTESDRLRLVIRHDTATGALMCTVRDASAEVAGPAAGPAGDPGAGSAAGSGAGPAGAAMDSAARESGRGLGIIDALSAAWGISTDGFGKWLWFCLDGAAGPDR